MDNFLVRSKENFSKWYRNLPEKKRYMEFLTAFLTIPVLLTVIITNVRNLQQTGKPNNLPTPNPTVKPMISESPNYPSVSPTQSTNTPTPAQNQCKPVIGPVEIIYPAENEIVTSDPICLEISYPTGDYCPVVWSYRLNNNQWSSYTSNQICLYNVSPGDKTLYVKVKSLVSQEEKILKRLFTIANLSPTPTVSTSSASLSN